MPAGLLRCREREHFRKIREHQKRKTGLRLSRQKGSRNRRGSQGVGIEGAFPEEPQDAVFEDPPGDIKHKGASEYGKVQEETREKPLHKSQRRKAAQRNDGIKAAGPGLLLGIRGGSALRDRDGIVSGGLCRQGCP